MGLTRQYVRYTECGLFGVVGSQKSNLLLLNLQGSKCRYCAVGVCENVIIWDLKTSEKFRALPGEKHEVTVITASPDNSLLAAGYNNGTVRIFNIASGDVSIVFNGHKSAVSALNFDDQGLRLVSGAKDTDVVVWDVVSESGLFRLKGHKGLVTQAKFVKGHNFLLTSSKDTFIKFWDLDTQHCFYTLVGHRSEIYDFVLLRDDTVLVTGSADSELRVWEIHYKDKETDAPDAPDGKDLVTPAKRQRLGSDGDDDSNGEEDSDEDENIVSCSKLGSVIRKGRNRLVSMVTDRDKRLLLCHGNDTLLEIYQILSEEEQRKHLAKRQKKANKKQKKDSGVELPVEMELTMKERFPCLNSVKMSGKLQAVDVHLDKPGQSQVVCLLTNNSLEMCSVDLVQKNCELSPFTKLTMQGHRSDVRTLSFSSDSTAILSASGELAKVWNRTSLQPIRTMRCGYALCSLFAPGDRHVIIGTKTGTLQLFDLSSGTLLEEISAHSGPLWSISMAADKRSIVSGSADSEVKFWNFEIVEERSGDQLSKRLSLEHSRTLKMDEEVLCVKYSPDQRLLAVALLDNTVKVFFADTLKFFLSLYGHKLPVLCLDISSDSTLIVTGSADRNIKIWGLDFGDCHKSIFAHDDSIMCVQFVPKTHFIFSGGKDHKLKEWDADNFEHIQTLEGHHSEVWCLAVSPSGNFLVSGSHDKSLRLWEKTQEPLILEEERELEREREHEESLGQGQDPVVAGESNTEVGLAGKQTLETVKAAERIMEALQVCKREQYRLDLHNMECEKTGKQIAPPAVSPMLSAMNASCPQQYVLEIVRRIRSSELDEALLVLPFDCVIELLKLIQVFLDNGWETELSTKCLLFLLRVHQGQITANQVLLPVIDKLRKTVVVKSEELKDRIGFNLAGLQFLKRHIEEDQEVQFFTDATDRRQEKRKKEKKRAVLTIHT
ncbi:WD repeat-containing protein 3-like [Liolophura sinensis]|uniref:WD repeat-containing protein 3-like n=1 Tax=Liolophura sinensis TaxID=3198878 RepID=UPI0031599225